MSTSQNKLQSNEDFALLLSKRYLVISKILAYIHTSIYKRLHLLSFTHFIQRQPHTYELLQRVQMCNL